MNKKKYILLIIRIGVSASLILFLLKKVPFVEILKVVKNANPALLSLSLIIFFSLHFVGVQRWRILLSPLMKTSFLHLAFPFFGGLFFNLFFPSTLAGDFFRSVLLFDKKRSSAHILASVFLDRISGFLALSSLCMFSFLFNPQLFSERDISLSVLVVSLGVIGVVFLSFKPYVFNLLNKIFRNYKRLSSLSEKLKNAFEFFKKNPKVFMKSFLISLPIHTFANFSIWLLFKALGAEVRILDVLVLGSIVNLLSMIPLTIAGLGVRDASSIFYFSKLGVYKSICFSASLLFFAFYILLGLLGGGMFALLYNRWLQLNKRLTFL